MKSVWSAALTLACVAASSSGCSQPASTEAPSGPNVAVESVEILSESWVTEASPAEEEIRMRARAQT